MNFIRTIRQVFTSHRSTGRSVSRTLPRGPQAATVPCSPSVTRSVAALCDHFEAIWKDLEEALIPGFTTAQVEERFLAAVADRGVTSAFKGYRAYPYDTTISVNEEIINTFPSQRRLEVRDRVKLQFALRDQYSAFAYQAWSFLVGPSTPLTVPPMHGAALQALDSAVALALCDSSVGQISQAIESTLASHGLWPSPQYHGHGIGPVMHEEPPVPGCAPDDLRSTPLLTAGTLLSLVVLAHDSPPVVHRTPDGWGLVAHDNHETALFSHIVLVTDNGPQVLTPRPRPTPVVA